MSIYDLGPEEKPDFYVIARVVLTVAANTADEARAIAQNTLDGVDHWPTVDIEEVTPFG